MTSLYAQIKEIAEQHIREKSLLQSYSFDLYLHDHDTLTNDSQAGDQYLWILRKHGSQLIRLLGCETSQALAHEVFRINPESKAWHLNCSGDNEGSVTSVSHARALELTRTVTEAPGRVPRRAQLRTTLSSMMGSYDGTEIGTGISQLLDQAYDPNAPKLPRPKNNIAFLRIVRDGNIGYRASLFIPSTGAEFHSPIEGRGVARGQFPEGCWRIKAAHFGFGVIEPATPRALEAARKKTAEVRQTKAEGRSCETTSRWALAL